jgi:hypothetical protein
VERVIESYVKKEESYLKFLQTHLTGCAKEKHSLLFRELMLIIANVAQTEMNVLEKIIHYKINDADSIFNKTALSWANENIDQFMALELVKREHDVHKNDEKEGLKCLKNNLKNTALLPWITKTFINFFEDTQYCKAIATVLFQLLSYLFFILDIYFDINLAFSYHQFSHETFNMSELWMCGNIQLNSSCFERTGSALPVGQVPAVFNQTHTQTLYYEQMHLSFYWGFRLTVTLLAVTLLFYLGCIALDASPTCFDNVVEQGLQKGAKFFGVKDPPHWRVKWFCKMFLILVGKLVWPIVHCVRLMRYEAAPKRSQHQEQVVKSDAIWHNIKFVEYGLESSAQLFLQLWLLQPFLPTIAAWDVTELVERCISGFANFFTFELHPACYVEKILVKIVLAVLSLSLGMSQTRKKPGEEFLGTLPMLFSIVAQTIGRMFAFKSLVLMATHLGYYKYAVFLLTHITLVLVIKILFEVQAPKDNLLSWPKLVETMKTRYWKITRFIISGLSSTIVMIHLRSSTPSKHEWHSFFVSHALFHLLVLLENLAIVTLPFLLDEIYYPPPDCFTSESKLIGLGCVVGMGLLGVLMHVLQYKACHSWGKINGPQAWRLYNVFLQYNIVELKQFFYMHMKFISFCCACMVRMPYSVFDIPLTHFVP